MPPVRIQLTVKAPFKCLFLKTFLIPSACSSKWFASSHYTLFFWVRQIHIHTEKERHTHAYTHRETDTHTYTERDTYTEINRQTDTYTWRQAHRKGDRHLSLCIYKERDTERDRQTHTQRQTHTHRNRHRERHTHTERQTHIHKDRHTCTETDRRGRESMILFIDSDHATSNYVFCDLHVTNMYKWKIWLGNIS